MRDFAILARLVTHLSGGHDLTDTLDPFMVRAESEAQATAIGRDILATAVAHGGCATTEITILAIEVVETVTL